MLLEKYCDVLFADFKASGISTCRWPYGTLSVIDEENHSVICVHVLVIVGCNEAYEIMLETCRTWVPVMKMRTKKIIRTDDLASSNLFKKHLPALQFAGLCNFHIREM